MAGKCNIERRHGPAVGPGDRLHRHELLSCEWLPAFYDFNLVVGFTSRSKRGDRAKWKRTKAGCLQIRTQARGSFLSTFPSFPLFGEAGADQQQKRISFNTLEGGGWRIRILCFCCSCPLLPAGMAVAGCQLQLLEIVCEIFKMTVFLLCLALLCYWVVRKESEIFYFEMTETIIRPLVWFVRNPSSRSLDRPLHYVVSFEFLSRRSLDVRHSIPC